MSGQRVRAEDFGHDAIPPASFAVLVALAFDADRAAQWEHMHVADKVAQGALLTVWAREVWPKFTGHYGLE